MALCFASDAEVTVPIATIKAIVSATSAIFAGYAKISYPDIQKKKSEVVLTSDFLSLTLKNYNAFISASILSYSASDFIIKIEETI